MLWTMGLSAVLARNSAVAQQRTWRVGFLALPKRPEPFQSSRFGAFVRGMRDLGYIEGRNLVIEWRFAENEVGRLAALATELGRCDRSVRNAGYQRGAKGDHSNSDCDANFQRPGWQRIRSKLWAARR
jgi:hypothetical protein